MNERRNLLKAMVGATVASATGLPTPHASAQYYEPENRLPTNLVYIESNNPAVGQNSIIGYRRAEDGSLTPLPGSPFRTGGRGFYVNKFPGPFDTDSELILDRRRGLLYAVNSGSSSVSVLSINRDGSLSPSGYSPYTIPGTNPISLGLLGDKLLVLNADADPAQHVAGHHPNLVLTETIGRTGAVIPLPYGSVDSADGSQPTQVLTTNTDRFIFTCQFFGGTIRSYDVEYGVSLRQLDSQVPPVQPGSATPPLPLGLWAHDHEPILYVGFVTANLLGVYRWDHAGKLTFLRAVPSSGKAICWMRTAFSGARLYATNTGDNSISVYDTTTPDQPKEIQNLVVGGLGGIVTFDISPDARFLYAIEQLNNPGSPAAVAQGNRLHVIAIDRRTGVLSDRPTATVRIDVPDNTIPQGVVVL